MWFYPHRWLHHVSDLALGILLQVFWMLLASDQQCSAARRQVEKHILEPTRAIRKGIAEIFHVNRRRDFF